jgi:putative sigma-54 modulation protein
MTHPSRRLLGSPSGDGSTRRKETIVRIEVHGRNVEVTDDLREAVMSRFKRVGKQVSELASLEILLRQEKNPRITDKMVAEATLRLKGVTLHAEEATPDMLHSIHELAEDIRRQVKKHREKRRKRHRTRKMAERLRAAAKPQDFGA